MNTPLLAHKLRAIFCILSLAAMSGCALLSPLPPEEAVAKRAEAWATAVMDGDWREAYIYTSPGYRQTANAGRYHAQIAGAKLWNSATIRSVECLETACEVTFILEYPAYKMDIDIRTSRTYKWVEVDGDWWLYVGS